MHMSLMALMSRMSREARIAIVLALALLVVSVGAYVSPYIVAVVFAFLAVGVTYVLVLLPAYTVGKRQVVSRPGQAFIPWVGAFIVLLRVMGQNAWWAVLGVVPYVGTLILYVWLAIVIPRRHGRTGWWTLAFIFVPIASFYAYAFTLPREGLRAQVSVDPAGIHPLDTF
jgi:hypothetical protein